MLHTRITAALGAAILTLGLAACGDDSDADESTAPAASQSDTSQSDTSESAAAAGDGSADIEAGLLELRDPWVKAADAEMTGAFGTLVNTGERDITVVGATTDAAATVELHETVAGDDGAMMMRPKEDGFVIPAGEEHELAPGGDHLMLMELQRALKPGERLIIELELADGSTIEVDATVKHFTGAEEEYQGGHGGSSDADHQDADHQDAEHQDAEHGNDGS